MILRAVRSLASLGLIALVCCVSGCLDSLFAPPIEQAAIVVLKPASLGNGLWTVILSARDMPDGGLAGILIRDGGLITQNVDVSSLSARGLNGFIVTAQAFTGSCPNGALIAVRASGGVEDGRILELRFRATGSNPSLAIDPSHVVLSSGQGTRLEGWEGD